MSTPAKASASRIVAVLADLHIGAEDRQALEAVRRWHRHVRPDTTVLLGDFVDLGMLSRFLQSPEAPHEAIPQVRAFAALANALAAEARRVVVVEGNHDERWSKALGPIAHTLRGALGLTLEAQCRAQGLDPRVEWVHEDARTEGVRVGQFVLRHGHNQSGRFGGGKHLAATRITKSLGVCEVFGHHHRGQVFCQSAHGRTAIAVACPCLAADQDYQPDPDWQRGFVVLELSAPEYTVATPHLVLIEGGRFSWGGRTYDGRPRVASAPAASLTTS